MLNSDKGHPPYLGICKNYSLTSTGKKHKINTNFLVKELKARNYAARN